MKCRFHPVGVLSVSLADVGNGLGILTITTIELGNSLWNACNTMVSPIPYANIVVSKTIR